MRKPVGAVSAGACVTVTAAPEIVIVPFREAFDVLVETEKRTVPFPVPLPPLVIVIQEALSVAVHVQPLPAVIATLEVPAAAGMAMLVGDAVIVHGSPLCVTLTVCPPIASAPFRDELEVFAVTE